MWCPKCGAQLAPGAAFCSRCGTTVAAPAVPPPMAMVPYQQPMMLAPGFGGCPRCGSPMSQNYKTVYIVLAVLLFPIGLLFLTAPKERKCMNFRCNLTI